MTEKKSDKEEKSNSSFLKSVKDMAKKLDPDLPTEPENKSQNESMGDKLPENKSNQATKDQSTQEVSRESEDQSTKKSSNSSSMEKSSPSQKKDSAVKGDKSSQKSTSDKHEDHSDNPLMEYFHKLSSFVHEDKERVIRIAGIVIGAIFILSGILLLFGGADKISDNVIFGERAVMAAFMVIIGLLIVAGALAQRIVGKTSFDGLYREVKIVEEKKSEDDKKTENKEKVNSSTPADSENQKK